MEKKEKKAVGPDGISRSLAKEREINIDFVSLFGSELGKRVLKHLRRTTIENVAGPHVTNDVLRHMEGQRFIVGIIEQRVIRGHKAKAGEAA